MLQLTLMQNIARFLARFTEEVKLLNGISDFSINIHAENMLVTLLNKVYGLELVNLNPSGGNNVAAIDLLDATPGKEIAFQVTATASIEKVKDCIRKYFENKGAGKLKVFIITARQASYSQEAIDKVIREVGGTGWSFNVEEDILDRRDLYNHLYAQNDLEQIREVEQYLRQQFGLVDEKDRLAGYYQRLKNMFYETVMDDEKGLTLDQIYIEPSFAVIRSALNKNERIQDERKKFFEADDRYKVQEFIEDMFSGRNPLRLDVQSDLVLILGYPGQGKSSFCKKLVNSYIRSGSTARKPLFYFQLRNIRRAKEFISDPLTILYEEACKDTGQPLDRYQFHRSFLVLDGLDELYLRENLRIEDIDRLSVELVRLLERQWDLNIVLTSRYGYIDDGKLAKENINIIQLMSLSEEMQLQWLAIYRTFHPESWLTEKILRSFHKMAHFSHIRELIEQPLLLHMIASIKNAINKNTNRSMVYHQLFSELIDRRYAREGQIEMLKGVTKNDLRDLIREVAFAIFKTGNEYITNTELLELEAALSFLQLLPEESFRNSIKGVMISFYFKETEDPKDLSFGGDQSGYAIEFLHRSLREYMTAEKIFFTAGKKFLGRKENGEYIINDAKSALEVINELFGAQPLPGEILGHLKEIAKNATDINAAVIVERMLHFLPDFFECDFIIEYRMEQGNNPIDYSLRCFYGLWQFVSILGIWKNHLHTYDIRKDFTNYFRFIGSVTNVDLSYQELNDQVIDFNLYDCDLSFVNLSNSQFFKSTFVRCRMKSIVFDGSTFGNVDLFESDLHKCSFRWATIDGISLEGSRLEQCDFSNARFVTLKGIPELIDCDFSDAFVEEDAFNKLEKLYPVILEQGIRQEVPYNKPNSWKKFSPKQAPPTPPENYKRLLLDQ